MTLDPAYVHQRFADPDMKVRDAGQALATVVEATYPRLAPEMAFDSGTVTDRLGDHLVAELERRGYRLTFTGRKAAHK